MIPNGRPSQIGAILTTSADCVEVESPSNPDPPFVAISAPDAVGYCDPVILEGSASFTSLGARRLKLENFVVANCVSLYLVRTRGDVCL